MARSAGVEPATARFVAEYSIQLSYERVRLKPKLAVKAKNYTVILAMICSNFAILEPLNKTVA